MAARASGVRRKRRALVSRVTAAASCAWQIRSTAGSTAETGLDGERGRNQSKRPMTGDLSPIELRRQTAAALTPGALTPAPVGAAVGEAGRIEPHVRRGV